tara:strand:+ start:170 stop:904 length:735 start_codon:yes stop_codon:yes gene_type:complete
MLGLSLGVQYPNNCYFGFPPRSIASGNLVLWLQHNTGQTANASNFVAKWNDQSGNNNHALQDTDLNKATLSTGSLDFDGTNDHYDLTSTITIADSGAFCLAAVVELDNLSGTILSKDANDQFAFVDGTTFRFKSDSADVTSDFVFEANTFTTGTKVLILLNKTAGAQNSFSFFKNGAQLTPSVDSINTGKGQNPGGFDLNVLGSLSGTSNFFDGKMFEVAFWNTSLTASEIADVSSYFIRTHAI